MIWLRRTMSGRYGTDQLGAFLLVLYVILTLLSYLPHMGFLSWLALACVLLALYRLFSRQLDKRRMENARFMAAAGPAIRWFKVRRTIHRDKEHRYFRCPNCGLLLRVPRGKGKITVNCRNCGISFEEKS